MAQKDAATEKQFDSVSWGDQDKVSCTMYLGLDAMKTQKKMGSYKPTNTEIPLPVIDDQNMTITAVVQNEAGKSDVYQWVKRHQGKVKSAKIKIDSKKGDQLKVTLVKAGKESWLTPFQTYLLEL